MYTRNIYYSSRLTTLVDEYIHLPFICNQTLNPHSQSIKNIIFIINKKKNDKNIWFDQVIKEIFKI